MDSGSDNSVTDSDPWVLKRSRMWRRVESEMARNAFGMTQYATIWLHVKPARAKVTSSGPSEFPPHQVDNAEGTPTLITVDNMVDVIETP